MVSNPFNGVNHTMENSADGNQDSPPYQNGQADAKAAIHSPTSDNAPTHLDCPHDTPRSNESSTYTTEGAKHCASAPSSISSLEGVSTRPRSDDQLPQSTLTSAHSFTSDLPTVVNEWPTIKQRVEQLLGGLTMQNFEDCSNIIIMWTNMSQHEEDVVTLRLVTMTIYERAINDASQSVMYARLCRKMMERISPNVQDKRVRGSAGQLVVGGQLFRKYLLNCCQEDFQRGWIVREVNDIAAAARTQDGPTQDYGWSHKRPDSYSGEDPSAEQAQRLDLGSIRFIGELFKVQMLTERIMHECIRQLLSNIDTPEEEDVESLCCLLKSVGQVMDTTRAQDHMNVYFTRLNELTQNQHLTPQVRSMVQVSTSLCIEEGMLIPSIIIQDVITLRAQGWGKSIYSRGIGQLRVCFFR